MLEFSIALQDQNGSEFPPPRELKFTPQRFGARATGGYDQAEIAVDGPEQALWALLRLLGYRLTIRNRNGSVVWFGYIDEAQVTLGVVQVGLALEGMANKVAVAYSTTVNGTSEDGVTAWASDAESVARYGTKELLLTLSETNLSQAQAYRDAQLQARKYPVVQRSFGGGGGGEQGGVLRCRGYFDTLGWRYYVQLSGLEENGAAGNSNQALGWGLTATTIGFTNDGKIHDLTGRFNQFTDGGKVQITGSASNNGERLVTGVDSRKAQSYTATSISFDATDDVHDFPNDGFGFVQTSDYVQISGAPGMSNNGIFRCKSASADHLVVKPASIGVEPAGNAVTIARGNYIQTNINGAHEGMGASITLTAHGQQIAQSFTLSVNLAWTVDRILCRLQRVGTPGDSVTVQLRSDGGGVPGAVIEQATVAASSISTAMDWVAFVFTNVNGLSYGVTYWLVMSRTGANDATHYYLVDMDEKLSYAGGALKLWTGSAWVARATDADLVFRVLGSWMTTTQIQQIVTDVGQFFAGTLVENTSGIGSNQYRNGEATGLDEAEALLESGTSNGRRLLAEVTPGRVLRVYEQPVNTAVNLLMDNDGNLTTLAGGMLEPGKLPVGQWVALTQVPPTVGALSQISPFFLERAEYDCQSGKYSALEPQGSRDAWEVGGITAG